MIHSAGMAAPIHASVACVRSMPPVAAGLEPKAMRPYSASTPKPTPIAPRAASFAYLRTEGGVFEADEVMVEWSVVFERRHASRSDAVRNEGKRQLGLVGDGDRLSQRGQPGFHSGPVAREHC